MIFIGIDMVHISRFEPWLNYKEEHLATLFSAAEIAQLHAKEGQKAAFLASRFAVKEACYKALSSLCAHTQTIQPFSLRTVARYIEIKKDPRWHTPELYIHRDCFTAATGITLPATIASVSLSHEREYAIAQVVLHTTTK